LAGACRVAGCGIQNFPQHPISLDEYVSAEINYSTSFDGPYDPPAPSIPDMLRSLANMIDGKTVEITVVPSIPSNVKMSESQPERLGWLMSRDNVMGQLDGLSASGPDGSQKAC